MKRNVRKRRENKIKELNKNRKYKCNSYWLYKFRNIRESKYKRRTFKYSIWRKWMWKQEQLNREINAKISKLHENQSDYNDFKIYLNGVFESINLHIRLKSDETTQNYYLYHDLENISLNMKDISEGERKI